jgi:hypothetical protein
MSSKSQAAVARTDAEAARNGAEVARTEAEKSRDNTEAKLRIALAMLPWEEASKIVAGDGNQTGS